MEQQLAWAAGRAGDEDAMLSGQTDTEAYYGRLVRARDYSRRASSLQCARVEGNGGAFAGECRVPAKPSSITQPQRGKAQMLQYHCSRDAGRDVKLLAARNLARAGETAKANRLIEQLERTASTDTMRKLYCLPTIHGAIETSKNNRSQGIRDLEAAVPYELGGTLAFQYLYPLWVRSWRVWRHITG
jgi:hypothetical protein